MKVAAILPVLEIYGGVRRYIEIGNELTRRGHKFILFVEQDGGTRIIYPDWIKCNFEIYGTEWISDPKFSNYGFDIAIASECGFEYFVRVNAKKRVYYSINDNRINDMSLSVADIVAVNSAHQFKIMKEKGISAVDWIGGINIEQFCPNNLKKKVHPPQIILQGKWSEDKATGYAIRAIELAAKKHQLIFAPFSRKEKITARCLTDCEKYFLFPGDRIAEIYQESTIAISISLFAGWDNVAIESMACGTPVICGKAGTEDFAVHMETALVVPEKDINAIANAITLLLEDKQLYEKLSKQGQEKAKEFTWQKVVDKIEGILK